MKRTEAESQQTKELLLESAIEVIGRKGYAKATLEDIVKNVGLTRGAFYWHFTGKQDMLVELERRYVDWYQKCYQNIPVCSTVTESLEQLLHRIFSSPISRISYLMKYRVEAATELSDFLERQKMLDQQVADIYIDLVRKGIANGEFLPDLDPEKAGMQIFISILGYEDFFMLHDRNDPDDRCVRFFDQDTLISNLLAPFKNH